MRRSSIAVFLFVYLAFLAGCAHEEPTTPPAPKVAYEEPVPQWFVHPPENNASTFFVVGSGPDAVAALKQARDRFRSRWSEATVAACKEGMKERDGICRYLSEEALREMKELLKEGKIPARIVKKRRLSKERTVVLAAIDRKAYAKPYKEALLKRLVAIEERWHRSGDGNVLQRYRLAQESYDRMRDLLPLYCIADRIAPYGDNMVRRVEKSIPYFANVSKRLKKRLRFCVEPVRVPALRLFAGAVEEGLKAKKLVTQHPSDASSDTLCITVSGKLQHERRGEKHLVVATITLKLHERYKAPVATQVYRVRGVSNQSGTAALERAAEALRKRVEKEFLLSV